MIPFADQLRVVLVSSRNPLNIGAAARAISNFGFSHLRVVNPYQVAYQEAVSAVNAGEILRKSEQFATVAEAITDCSLVVGTTSLGHRELDHSLHRLELGGRLIREHLPSGPVALLFGSEKFGLSNDDMSHCHWLMRIPTRDEHGSMNLGQAVSVCLYELIRSEEASTAQPEERKPAAGEQVEMFHQLLKQTLDQSGYINPNTADTSEQKLRRMIHRLNLNARDTYVWLGMFRQILWKLNHPN